MSNDLLQMARRSLLSASDEGPAFELVLSPAINQLRSKLRVCAASALSVW
jgi:hypothetical protein